MAHLHSVYDNDTHFRIDPATRKIKNESGKVILMQNDHNSERFTFEIPRYIDGHDMSVCNKVEVHFINLKADKTEKNADVYPVEDLQISPDSEDVVICSWLISQNATKYAGSLNFVLRYACLTGEVIDYQWYTDIHNGISVSESISNAETVATEYSDILEAWREELMQRENIGVGDGGGSAQITESFNNGDTANVEDVTAVVLHGKNIQGKNLCSLGTVEVNVVGEFDIDEIPPGVYTYSAEVTTTNTGTTYMTVQFLDKDTDTYSCEDQFVMSQKNSAGRYYRRTRTFTKKANKMRIYAGHGYNGSQGHTATFANFQIEAASVETPYEPYGTAYGIPASVSLGDVALSAAVEIKRNESIDFVSGEVVRADGTKETVSVQGEAAGLSGEYLITAENTVDITHRKSPYVRFTKQALTEKQKAQARENIGAVSDLISSISVEFNRKEGASYVYARIPYVTNGGHSVRPKVRLTSEDGSLTGTKYSTLQYAKRENTAFAINAGLFNVSTAQPLGQTIIDGVSIVNEPHPQGANNETISDTECYPLCIDGNGILSAPYPRTVDTATMIADGIVQACAGWVKLVENYTICGDEIATEIVHPGAYAQQAIGQFENGDYCVCTVAMRGYGDNAPNDNGLSYTQVAQILVDKGVKFAYALDGGGSTQTVIGKRQINPIYEGTEGRRIPAVIVFEVSE